MAKSQKVVFEKANLEKRLQEEIKGLEDASYAMFEEDFDEAIT